MLKLISLLFGGSLMTCTTSGAEIIQLILRFSLILGFIGEEMGLLSFCAELRYVFLRISSSASIGRCSQLQLSLTSSFSRVNSCFFNSSNDCELKASPSTREATNYSVLKRDHRNLSSYSQTYLSIKQSEAAATGPSRFPSPWIKTDSPDYFAWTIASMISLGSAEGHQIWGQMTPQWRKQLGSEVRLSTTATLLRRISSSSCVRQSVPWRMTHRPRRVRPSASLCPERPFECKRLSNYSNYTHSQNTPPAIENIPLDEMRQDVEWDVKELLWFIDNFIMSSELTEGEERLFQRLDAFASQSNIDLVAFWRTSRLCLTLEEFLELSQKTGFTLSTDDLRQLERECVEFVNLETLLRNVETWRKVDNSISNFLSRQAIQQEEKANRKTAQKGRDSRIKTNSSFGDFKDSRVRATERQWRQEVKLNETLIRAKNESDYELTIRVGEANDICKKLKNDCSFIIDSGSGEARIIEVQSKTGEEVELPKKMFEKRYEQLKIASLVRGEEVEGTLEEDLKKVLVEVMYLSGQLEEQIKLLQAKGVTH